MEDIQSERECNNIINLLLKEGKWQGFFQGDPSKYSARCSKINLELFMDIYESRIESLNLRNLNIQGLIELVHNIKTASPEQILIAIVNNQNETRYVYTDENISIIFGII